MTCSDVNNSSFHLVRERPTSFAQILFVAPNILARVTKPLVATGIYMQKRCTNCSATNAPQLAIHCGLWCHFHERVQSRYFFEQSVPKDA